MDAPRRRQAWGWGLAALAVAALVWADPPIVTRCAGPGALDKIRAAAKKWAAIFGVPVSTVLAISRIESGHRPDCVNWSVRSVPLGGAWGPLQMTQRTAKDWARRLAKHGNAAVRAAAARWDGKGRTLTRDVDLAVMLSTAFLGDLTRRFGTFAHVAAAYHQGAGKVLKMRAAGQAIPAELPPKGKEYVTRALAAQKALAA